jgi:hypothetical protein
MRIIAHRGLINGPDPNLENLPEQILTSLQLGFDCEIDVSYINGKWFLGHDTPDYEVPFGFLRLTGLWLHAKNLAALHQLSTTDLAYFWHQGDDVVITSNGYLWTYPEKPLTDRSIRLMPEWHDPELTTVKDCGAWAVCSDYAVKLRSLLG